MPMSLGIPGLKSALFSHPSRPKAFMQARDSNEIRRMKLVDEMCVRTLPRDGRSAAIWLVPKLMAFCGCTVFQQHVCAGVNLEERERLVWSGSGIPSPRHSLPIPGSNLLNPACGYSNADKGYSRSKVYCLPCHCAIQTLWLQKSPRPRRPLSPPRSHQPGPARPEADGGNVSERVPRPRHTGRRLRRNAQYLNGRF